VKKYKNILVCGLGMMGASLCKSIKRNKITSRISGFDNNPDTLKYAQKNKIIDTAHEDLYKIDHPDLVILCTPISTYTNIIEQIIESLEKKTILTDIGSSKGNPHLDITKKLSKSKIDYLSSHPMVGSENSGIKSSKSNMFENKIVFIIDKMTVKQSIYNDINSFWLSMGAVTHSIDKKKHDDLMAKTSHISHLMSYIFMQSLPQSVIDNNLSLLLGGGIKEHVRLSKSDPTMWSDIFINNRKNIKKTIATIEKNISQMKNIIDKSEKEKLKRLLEKIQSKTI
tara:strand:+ start:660 stop:1508 length:849 start_codon:yes stop_codon:yes gene_type:complete